MREKVSIHDGDRVVNCCINCGKRGIIQFIKETGDYIWQCSSMKKILQGDPTEIHSTCERDEVTQ